MKHNYHIFPKWVILPRIPYGDKLFSLKQKWRTKLFSLEREDVHSVVNILLCVFPKIFSFSKWQMHEEEQEEEDQEEEKREGEATSKSNSALGFFLLL